MQSKTDLRKAMLEKRKQLAPKQAADDTRKIATHLRTLIAPSAQMGGYIGINGEVDAAAIAEALGWTHLALPCVENDTKLLIFREWKIGEALIEGKYGIRCPAPEAPKVNPDILLIPLLAFDKHGHRLGYGGGYYDATVTILRKSGPVKAIGLAYSFQQVDSLPDEPHDAKLDMVVTEKQIWTF